MHLRSFLRAAVASGALLAAAPMALAADLTIGVRAGPDSIDPHWSTLGSQSEALRHIYDTLVMSSEDLKLVPGLAESWTPVDDTTWEFKLRPNVKFHNGEPLTANDVKFSIERIPKVTGPQSMTIYTKRVDSVEVVDDLTVRVKTKGPAPALPNDFVRLFVVPASTGEGVGNEQFNSGEKAIGTGPYKFVSWTPKGDLVLEKNAEWWGGDTPWDRVTRKEIAEDAARVAALKSGQVGLINYVPAADYLVMQGDSSVQTFVKDSIYVLNLSPMMKDTTPQPITVNGAPAEKNPLQDVRVREALDLAIDRDGIVRVVLEGVGYVANQLQPEGFFGWSGDIPAPKADPERAKALLAEAGYPDGFGMDLTCTNNRVPGDSVVCEAIAQMWSKIGVQTKATALNGTVFFPEDAKEAYTMTLKAWGTVTGEGTYTYGSLVHSKDEEKGLGAFNRNGYANPEVDRLFEEAQTTLDDAKREDLLQQVAEISMKDRALIPTVGLQTIWAAQGEKLDWQPRMDQETLAWTIKPAQ